MNRLLTAIGVAVVVGWLVLLTWLIATSPTPPVVQDRIEEDEPGWDFRTQGNRSGGFRLDQISECRFEDGRVIPESTEPAVAVETQEATYSPSDVIVVNMEHGIPCRRPATDRTLVPLDD